MPSKSLQRLTHEQAAALEATERSVSLAAGAGCGKTFVLTERFLSCLDPSSLVPTAGIDELVAITFTDAAAREMRDRIRRRCHERLQQARNQSEQVAWQDLIRTLDVARITTIHSFCASLLRSYAAEAGVDPRFELLDGPATELLRLRTLDDRLRELLILRDERLIKLATHFDLGTLREYLANLLGQDAELFFSQWKKVSADQLIDNWLEFREQQIIPSELRRILASDPMVQLKHICGAAAASSDRMRQHLQEIDALLNAKSEDKESVQNLLQLTVLAKTQGVCTKKDWHDEEQYSFYRDTCKAVRDLINKSVISLPIPQDALCESATLGLELIELLEDITDCYVKAKRDRNVLEFDDLLLKTHELLTSNQFGSVQEKIRNEIRLLMVDEFQDTDSLQVEIVKALCGFGSCPQGLFVVGDFKQSIYRFRGAEPAVSSQLRSSLPPESRLSLTTNFRSQPAIIEFVNALFHDAFQDTYEPLRAHRPQQIDKPTVEFLWASENLEMQDYNAQQSYTASELSRMQEARYIARRLAQLLDSGKSMVVDEASKEPRPLELGDIAVLLRSLSDVSIYEAAFREHGLDYYLSGGHAFYSQQEIYDVLNLLRAVASTADELSLAGALRSPLFSFEDELLYSLVQCGGTLNAGLYSEEVCFQLSPEMTAKVKRAAHTLSHLRRIKDQVLVAELMHEAIAQTGYDGILLAEFLGQRKLANVMKLVDQASNFDKVNPGDLNGFITQLSEFVIRAPKEALAASNADSNVIRIMTIHHAKGLEFPLVVVPDLNRKQPPLRRVPVLHKELGPLVPPEKSGNEEAVCVGWNLYQTVERFDEEEERVRLLYVACTRAADYLILSSSFKDIEKELQNPASDWLKFLNQHFDLKTGDYQGELPAGYQEPSVLVTIDEPESSREPSSGSRGKDLSKLVEKTQEIIKQGMGKLPESVLPIPVDTTSRQRFSFSRLSGQLSSQNVSEATREVVNKKSEGTDPRGLGSLVHAVLERIDFGSANDVSSLCHYLAPEFFDSNWQPAVEVASKMLQDFLSGPRANRLADAKQIKREIEFLLPWNSESDGGLKRHLHGYIDCLYQSQDGMWHLLDFKSNHITEESVPEVAEKYKLQMYVYWRTCTEALGVDVSESVLCFLKPGVEFNFRWDGESCREMDKQIDTAMHAILCPSQRAY